MSNLVNDLGGASGFGEQFITRNDDGYTSAIDLKPIFGNAGLNFFGASYTSLVINNNGNVVFGSSGLSSYTPWAMQTNTDIKMLAAYFADVDTRGYATNVNGPGAVTATPGGTSSGSNLVWYDMDSTGFGTLTITWDDVGYFSSQTNKLNAFQMRLIGTGNGGFDVEFRYENIDWTTGNASGGTSGLGGIVARAGFTAGDGVNYYELPQSGIQDQMLDLEITPGNTGVAGYYKFSIFGSGGTGDNTINGTSGDDFLVGGPGNDTINGLAGNDQIDGQGGTNLLVGGVGNDVYIIRSASDTVVEAPGEGNDTVQSSITFSVAGLPNIENITLTGNSAINATGNAESNWLISNSGNNILDGGTGIDTASYENTQSAVSVSLLLSGAQATGGGGTDTLIGIENLVGSIYNDALVGAADDNFLDGLAGADSMSGGAGNDTYVVDSASDVITENDNEGTDTVQSSIAYTLGANLENLLLTGLGNIDGVGNASNNVITGNSGSNNLDGGAGNDSINGGAGDDSLTGGTGNDALTGGTGTNTYLFARGFGVDTVASFAPSGANTDIVNFTDIASTEATISRSGLDAIIKIGTDQVTLLNYFNHTGAYQVASIRFANGVTWNDIPVNEAPAGTDKAITLLEDSSRILTAADFGFTDPNDSPANALAAVKITTLPTAGALKLNGVAVAAGQSVTAADLAANKLAFVPAANANGAGYASLTFQVQDNGGTANGGANLDPTPNTLGFGVTAVNDAPAGTDKSIAATAGAAYILKTADFGFTDPNDSPANALAAVKITTLPASGALKLNGVAVAAGQSVTAADIAANKLTFTPTANASLTFQVQDNGGTANGGADLDPTPNTLGFGVTTANHAPAGTDKSIAATAGAAYVLKTADFGFTDPNDSPANALAAVKITTLPASGALKLNGVAVAAGQSVTAADIAANKLTFTPTANASLTFQVQDNGGTANGGADLDPTPNTLSFTLGSGPAPLTNNDDIYTGTTAANSVDGLGGDDFLYGLDGNDSLFGGSGDDFLYGGSGNDSLVCGPGNNQLWGGSGNDYLFAGLENDLLDGGSGVDTASYASVPTAVNVSLLVLTPQNTLGAGIDTLASIENLIGGAGNDSLTGNAANNILQGGAGADTLTGGAGLDNFVLNTTTGGADLIKDFLSGTDILRFRDGATGFGIGDKDHVIDGGATINAPGGFAKAAELVIATANIAGSITAASAAAAIGSATAAYAAGDARVFAVDNGADSALFLFKSAGADALVSAGELTLLGTLQGTAQTALADYGFIA